MSGEPKSSAPFNSLAWLLATCPDSTVRDGGKAAGYIDQALELEPDRWTIWDTRAAVSAENGDFKDAITWEERCLNRKDLSSFIARGSYIAKSQTKGGGGLGLVI